MFFWTKNSERRTLNFFKSTDYSQQTTDFGYAVYCRDVTLRHFDLSGIHFYMPSALRAPYLPIVCRSLGANG